MIEYCESCGAAHKWMWEEAFDKFGFNDGDGLIMTTYVADALIEAGYDVECRKWGLHNEVIASIKKADGELIPPAVRVGYDDPRSYLPGEIVAILDEAFPDGGPLAARPDKLILQLLGIGYLLILFLCFPFNGHCP